MKLISKFYKGLSILGIDSKNFADKIWGDIFPESTREIEAWEKQFGLSDTLTTEQERRDRLDATWKALGGQDPQYIQTTLQEAGFNVFVHEFWELPRTTPPTVKDPRDFLSSAGDIGYTTTCGNVEANCGNPEANCGSSLNPKGFPLVNKIQEPLTNIISCGNINANCGDPEANCGAIKVAYFDKQFTIPGDPTKWPYFLYIGGETFPDTAIVPISRRNEFETLCLKICPAQQWLGMLIEYQ